MTKKFEKGCAVDVRGWDELPYGEELYGAIIKSIPYDPYEDIVKTSDIHPWTYLVIVDDKITLGDKTHGVLEILTPTDILGEHLVKAIEDGYKPYFKGDPLPCIKADIVLSNGFRASGNDMQYAIKTSSVIAYKPIEQPNLETATTKTFLVGDNKELIDQPSIQAKPTYEELVEKHLELSIKYDNCATKLLEAKALSEKVSPTSFLLLSEQSHNDLLNIKASAESIKKSDCEIAKALMREVFKELIDELDNKAGE